MESIELKYHRINTTAFINAKPVMVTLIPRTKVGTAGKGYKYEDGIPRQPQKMRIIELGAHQEPPVIQLTDGSQRTVDFWLLGEHDADIAVDDYWTSKDGRVWIVGDLVRTNHYETRALVVERGK